MDKSSTQYIRTDKAIIQAFIRLMRRMSFEKRTVQDIADETPVSRATFYHHFHDKYEIAERLMDDYIELEKDVVQEMLKVRKKNYTGIYSAMLRENRDLFETLLKIRTDRVDLQSYISKKHEEEYLSGTTGQFPAAEAKVYAAAMTSLQLSFLTAEQHSFPSDYDDAVMMAAFMRILQFEAQPEIIGLLQKKLEDRYG